MNINFNRNEMQEQKKKILYNQNLLNIPNSNSSYDVVGLFILFAMLFKACAQIPIIIKVTQKKSAEDISIITPIMFLVSFLILSIISLVKRLYMPLLIFTIGIITSTILIIQKFIYEKSKKNLLSKSKKNKNDSDSESKIDKNNSNSESKMNKNDSDSESKMNQIDYIPELKINKKNYYSPESIMIRNDYKPELKRNQDISRPELKYKQDLPINKKNTFKLPDLESIYKGE